MVRIKKNNFVYNKNIYQCIVPGCQNIDNDTNNPSKIYYYILSENGLQQKLLNTFLENVPIRPKVSRICSEHYTDDCFELQNGVKMLKPNAVPTIRTKQNSTTSIDTNDNIKRTDRPDKIINNMSNEKDINEKQNTKTDDKTLMGPPKTTVVKKSQLQSIQRDPTISPPLLNKNKEVYQHQRRQQECSGNLQQSQQHNGHLQQQLYERSPHLQPHNKHLQTKRQQEQLQQQQCRQQELQQQKQNENILHQQLQQHNGILQQQSILSPHQRQQQHNEELHRRQLLEPLHHKQQQQNCEKLKRQPKTQSKKSPQPNQNKEELKWQQQQKNKKELKQRTKRLQHKQVRSQQQPHNTNLSQRQQGGQSIHKKQQTQIEELQRRQQHEELWHQQIRQHNGNLKERIRTPPQQQHHPQEIQNAHLQNPQHHILNLEDRIQSSHHHHQQLQHGYSPNQHQQQYNEELQHHKEYKQLQYQKQQYHKQQLQQQYEHLQHQQHKEYLELNAKSSHQQQQQYKQMQYVQQQQLLQLQPKQNIFPEHHLLYDRLKTQQQSQPQTSSPIPHEEEHLIMCGYITFESCNNNFSYLCNFCQKNLENLDAFSAHLIRLHSNEIENEINSKASNKGDTTTTTNNLNEENTEKLKCGIINISSKSYNLILNCDFKFDCNFCDKKFEAINKFSEHIGKRHLDLLEKDRENDMEFEDDIDIDPSCILSFDQIDEINGIDTKLNSSMISNNNNSNNKVVMSVPISDNSEIFMTIDINENNNNNNNNSNNKNLNSSYNKESVQQQQQQQQQNISMEFDSIEKRKLRVNIKHSSWATRYFS